MGWRRTRRRQSTSPRLIRAGRQPLRSGWRPPPSMRRMLGCSLGGRRRRLRPRREVAEAGAGGAGGRHPRREEGGAGGSGPAAEAGHGAAEDRRSALQATTVTVTTTTTTVISATAWPRPMRVLPWTLMKARAAVAAAALSGPSGSLSGRSLLVRFRSKALWAATGCPAAYPEGARAVDAHLPLPPPPPPPPCRQLTILSRPPLPSRCRLPGGRRFHPRSSSNNSSSCPPLLLADSPPLPQPL